jgi:hypothetical protein
MPESVIVKKISRLWEVWIQERGTEVRSRDPKLHLDACAPFLRGHLLMEVDGVGLHVKHERGHIPTEREVRQHLIGVETRRVYVEADSMGEALTKVVKEQPGFCTGGRATATEFVDGPFGGGVVKAIPLCSRMHWRDGTLACIHPDAIDDVEEAYCGCVLDGYDPPDDCPVRREEKVAVCGQA